MSIRQNIGARAEKCVREMYEQRGFRFLESNFRTKGGEIDLVFEEPQESFGSRATLLVFVEVRVRRQGWVTGIESVDWRKRRRIERAAREFLLSYRGNAQEIRFDIAEWDGGRWRICQTAW